MKVPYSAFPDSCVPCLSLVWLWKKTSVCFDSTAFISAFSASSSSHGVCLHLLYFLSSLLQFDLIGSHPITSLVLLSLMCGGNRWSLGKMVLRTDKQSKHTDSLKMYPREYLFVSERLLQRKPVRLEDSLKKQFCNKTNMTQLWNYLLKIC